MTDKIENEYEEGVQKKPTPPKTRKQPKGSSPRQKVPKLFRI